VQKTNGVFVENRLRELIASGGVTARVLAPVPYLPGFVRYGSLGPLHQVPPQLDRDGLAVDHPRYLVVPKIGMNVSPLLLFHAMDRAFRRMQAGGYRPDLIDAHYFYPDGVAAVWLAQRYGLPVVVTSRGTDINLIPQYRLPRGMIQRAAAAADGLITVCEALRQGLIELGVPPAKVVTLRNGVDLERFRPIDRMAVREAMGLNRRTLVSVGHLIERKGHHHVIRALTDLPDTDLLIAGQGDQRSALEGLATELGVADRVRFLGSIDHAKLREVYNAADALVLASSREGWANVLLEAMACGTPVIASAVWGTPEVVASPEAGVLMSSLEADGVADGVRRLFAALPARDATRRYAEGFDWQSTTDGQLALFKRILTDRGDVPV
jgi:glycosyltransferase involved in cell wall biosynthesis